VRDCSASVSAHLTPRERASGTRFTKGWVDWQHGLEAVTRHVVQNNPCRKTNSGSATHIYNAYKETQKSVNLKHSLLLTGLSRFKPASQFVERFRSIMSCELNMEDLISKNVCILSKY
jgi:hypothetical protein